MISREIDSQFSSKCPKYRKPRCRNAWGMKYGFGSEHRWRRVASMMIWGYFRRLMISMTLIIQLFISSSDNLLKPATPEAANAIISKYVLWWLIPPALAILYADALFHHLLMKMQYLSIREGGYNQLFHPDMLWLFINIIWCWFAHHWPGWNKAMLWPLAACYSSLLKVYEAASFDPL